MVLLLCVVLPHVGMLGGAEGEGAKSLAVVETSAELAPLSLLVQAKLSQKGLVLVERGDLHRILQEQALSSAGLAEPDALVKVGALLRADAFLLLSLEEAGPPLPAPPSIPGMPAPAEAAPQPAKPEGLLRLRLTETAHGVRLLDWFVAWDPEKAEEAAAEIVAKVSEVAPKLKLPAGQVIPIGIAGMRRVQLEGRYEPICRAIGSLLAARLGKEPRLVVLEREDLRRLLDEKLLTAGEPGGVWRSGVLVESYMQGTGKEHIELKLEVKHATGESVTLAAIAVDTQKLSEAVDRAAKAVAAAANACLTTAWDPAQEAEEFYQQGMLLKRHGRYDAARPMVDTASALRPEELAYAAALLDVAVFEATLSSPDPHLKAAAPYRRLYTDEELADLVARVLPMVEKAMKEPPDCPTTPGIPSGTCGTTSTASPRWLERAYKKATARVARSWQSCTRAR